MKLNRGQAEAILHGEGPCLVLAPPGSGKTLIVTQRTKHLIESKHIAPENILVITFTRYAAKEMKTRFNHITKGHSYPVTFGTFHSVFFGILKCAYGITTKNLLSDQDRGNLIREMLGEIPLESCPEVEDDDELIKELAREIGLVKNGLLRLNEFKSEYLTEDEFAEFFREYENRKKQLHKFDFDDMLVQCYALFQNRPDILKNWQDRFRYILIDEFQDINRVQYEIIRMLAKPQNNLFVVGDDDQSIYSFRGARPELMLYMKQEYPDIRTIPLSVNYRSTEAIIGAATRVILHNESRFYKRISSDSEMGAVVAVKECLDEMDESRYLAVEIQKRIQAGVKPNQIAVLYRATIQARMASEILNEHQIPFEMKENIPNFYDHFIVRDMITYMKLARGMRDRNLFLQVGNRPVRYISRTCYDKSKVNFDDLRNFYGDKEWMQDIIDQFDVDLRMMEHMAPYAVVQYVRKRIGYDSFIKDYAKEKDIHLKELMNVLEEFENRCKEYQTLKELLKHIEAYSNELALQKEANKKIHFASPDKVQLMTMHASKGLEFHTVFIIDANEGEIPYHKAHTNEEIEEERRIFYVAMTRAKKELLLSYVTRKNGDVTSRSRFLDELLNIKEPEK